MLPDSRTGKVRSLENELYEWKFCEFGLISTKRGFAANLQQPADPGLMSFLGEDDLRFAPSRILKYFFGSEIDCMNR